MGKFGSWLYYDVTLACATEGITLLQTKLLAKVLHNRSVSVLCKLAPQANPIQVSQKPQDSLRVSVGLVFFCLFVI